MAETPPPAVRPWPKSMAVLLLFVIVCFQGAMWIYGFLALFQGDLPRAGTWLTWALAALLFLGWLWRWLVAMGRIGGRPTARFGGAAKD